ncbi:MAG TPA: 50S ribosomal protein L25, partial [Methylophaga sp.]|nr:50S ribosomal protein L25 [Methylophaga sp.]
RSSYDQAVVSIHEPRVAKVDLEEDTEADDEEEATED